MKLCPTCGSGRKLIIILDKLVTRLGKAFDWEVAKEFDISVNAVMRLRHARGIDPFKRVVGPEREEMLMNMRELRNNGSTLKEIGWTYGMSRQAVHQLLKEEAS